MQWRTYRHQDGASSRVLEVAERSLPVAHHCYDGGKKKEHFFERQQMDFIMRGEKKKRDELHSN